MQMEVITQRDDLLIRRHILEPGEALPWHVDLSHRFSVVVRGEIVTIDVHPGLADWDEPEPRVHRGINAGATTYEEVVTFYLDPPGIDPQPVQP